MRKITIHFRDYVDETKRRERRGGAVIVGIAALAIAMMVAKRPAVEPVAPPAPVPPSPKTETRLPEPAPESTTAPASSTAPAPVLTPGRPAVAPASLQFAPLIAGAASGAQVLTLRNAGEQPLAIRKVGVSGAGFRVTNGCGAALEGRASCSVAVVFAPERGGEHTGRVVVTTSGGRLNIPLRGIARPVPPVELAPLDFGKQQVGQHIAPQRVRFANSGALPVVIGDVALVGKAFSIAANKCEGVVPPGGECDVLIAFEPGLSGYEASLKFTAPDGSLVAHATITGAGVEAPRKPVSLDIKPRALRFLFGVTPPQRITITNPSDEAVKIYSVRIEGGGRSFKVDAKQCEGKTLAARGGTCLIVVGATASNRGADAMQILVDHSGAPQPDRIGASAAPR